MATVKGFCCRVSHTFTKTLAEDFWCIFNRKPTSELYFSEFNDMLESRNEENGINIFLQTNEGFFYFFFNLEAIQGKKI